MYNMEPENIVEELIKTVDELKGKVEALENTVKGNVDSNLPQKITIPGKGDAFIQVSRGGSIKKMI